MQQIPNFVGSTQRALLNVVDVGRLVPADRIDASFTSTARSSLDGFADLVGDPTTSAPFERSPP